MTNFHLEVITLSDKAIQFLLLIDALKNTNKNHPKTSKKLMQDIEAARRELFPNDPPASLSPATIGRHIKAMNQSGLYHIATCKNAKEGYYWNSFPFDAAEFSIIAQALFRSVAISTKETQAILNKFFNQTDDLGEGYLDIMLSQIQRTAPPRRKTSRSTLPIIRSIIAAIWSQQQIRFTYYRRNYRDVSRMEKRRSKETGKETIYQVSPYFLVWNADDFYLIAHYNGHDEKERKRLSHFKVSLISDKVQVLSAPTISITEMWEYPHYRMEKATPEYKAVVSRKQDTDTEEISQSLDRTAALVKFSLDRYMRENLFMFHDFSPLVNIRLCFREDFIGPLMAQFNLDSGNLKLYPTNRTFPDGEKVISAIVTAQDNEGLYMWLMQQGHKVTVAEPESVRNKLKKRYLAALKAIEENE